MRTQKCIQHMLEYQLVSLAQEDTDSCSWMSDGSEDVSVLAVFIFSIHNRRQPVERRMSAVGRNSGDHLVQTPSCSRFA